MLPQKGQRSQLFTLRVWTEQTADGRAEWRGKLERVVNGETLYFREWDALLFYLNATLDLPAGEIAGAERSEGQQVEQST